MLKRTIALLGTATALAAGAAPATAGSPGRWDRIGTAGTGGVHEVGVARAAAGGLRVVHSAKTASGYDLLSTDISRAGRTTAQARVDGITNWFDVSGPDLVAVPAGWHVFFPGARSIDASDTYSGVLGASAPPAGPWTIFGSPAAPDRIVERVGAAAAGDGSPFLAWGVDGDIKVGKGISGARPGFVAAVNAVVRDVAVDGATGQPWLGYVNRSPRGLFALPLRSSDGGPAGAAVRAPGSDSYSEGDLAHVVAARPGRPGVFLAYRAGGLSRNRVMLWRAGARTASLVASISRSGQRIQHVVPAADSRGRIWVAWTRSDGRVYARRSNRAVTRFGPTVVLRAPPRSILAVAASGQAARLDVVATGTTGTGGDIGIYHSQAAAPLTVATTPARLTSRGGVLRVRVTDAGSPVRGAVVDARGRRARTNGAGVATLRLPALGRTRLVRVRATSATDGAGLRIVSVRR